MSCGGMDALNLFEASSHAIIKGGGSSVILAGAVFGTRDTRGKHGRSLDVQEGSIEDRSWCQRSSLCYVNNIGALVRANHEVRSIIHGELDRIPRKAGNRDL